MVALFIILILILLIFFVPYGIEALYRADVLRICVKAGPFSFCILPKKQKEKSPKEKEREKKRQLKKEKKKQARKEKKEAQKKEKTESHDETIVLKEKRKLSFDFILGMLRILFRAVRRFFRSFTIEKLHLTYIVANEDPYKAAILYSGAGAVLESTFSECEKIIHIRDKKIVIGIDYTREKPELSAEIAITLQLFKIIHVVFALGIDYLIMKWQNRKKQKQSNNERNNSNGKQ